MKTKIALAVLISGRGSNLQSLIDACAQQDFPAEIKLVISNIPDAYGIERAKKAGIDTCVISHKNYERRQDFEKDMILEIKKYPIDLICQAGFMRILTPEFLSAFHNRQIINIHPSLLPKFKGLHVHERVLEAGENESGCTIHYVNEGVDEGEIILQRKVPVLKGDTPDSLAARVLEQEHIAYPEAVKLIASELFCKIR